MNSGKGDSDCIKHYCVANWHTSLLRFKVKKKIPNLFSAAMESPVLFLGNKVLIETYRMTSVACLWYENARLKVSMPLIPMTFLLRSRYVSVLWLRTMEAIAWQDLKVKPQCSSLWDRNRQKGSCPTHHLRTQLTQSAQPQITQQLRHFSSLWQASSSARILASMGRK